MLPRPIILTPLSDVFSPKNRGLGRDPGYANDNYIVLSSKLGPKRAKVLAMIQDMHRILLKYVNTLTGQFQTWLITCTCIINFMFVISSLYFYMFPLCHTTMLSIIIYPFMCMHFDYIFCRIWSPNYPQTQVSKMMR